MVQNHKERRHRREKSNRRASMPGAGQRDFAKEQHWRQVLADWQTSGLSIAEYCRQKNISPGQFYDWQKRLRRRAAEPKGRIRQRMAERANAIAEQAQRENQRDMEFAEAKMVERKKTVRHESKPDESGVLEVVFASGTKVRLSAGCPLELFASVASLLENR
jgi:hypothetical protein